MSFTLYLAITCGCVQNTAADAASSQAVILVPALISNTRGISVPRVEVYFRVNGPISQFYNNFSTTLGPIITTQ